MRRTAGALPLEVQTRLQLPKCVNPLNDCAKHDPIRRFVPTPYDIGLSAMGRMLRLQTNSSLVQQHLLDLFGRYSGTAAGSPDFLWRIVVESETQSRPPWPLRSTFSDEGIRFAQFGQRNFVAVDVGAREAIAFISQGLFDDAQGFTSPFIDTMFYLSSASLGLMPFRCASVSSEDQAVLVLGSPNQGKTTASYLASRDGLTIHADQSVFLELDGGELRAWGDFVPLAFRPETLQFLPELQSRARAFAYCDFRFCYVARPPALPEESACVIPVCCVLLERATSAMPRLTLLEGPEISQCLARHAAFRDDDRFEAQYRKILMQLRDLPAYRLAYGDDPATAAPFFRSLLMRHRKVM